MIYVGIHKPKLVACAIAAVVMTVVTGCKESDFDLSNIDSTIGLGGEQLQLPASSTEHIQLDNVLDLNNSDFISIAENGDYRFAKQGEDITPSHPFIDEVVVREAKIDNYFKIEIPSSALTHTTHAKGRRAMLSTPAEVEGKAAEFRYRGSVPAEIRQLVSARTSSELTIQVNVTEQLRAAIPTFKTLSVALPSCLKLNVVHCTPTQPDYDAAKGVLTFHNVPTSASISIKATVENINFTTSPSADNRLMFKAGAGQAEGTVELSGAAYLGVSFDEVNPTGASAHDLYLSAKMQMGPIVIAEATGMFNPAIDLADLGGVSINDVPDFLTGNDVTVNLHNPMIHLTASSDIDVAGFATPTLVAEDEQGHTLAQVDIPTLRIKPHGVTHICICKHAEGVDPSRYDEVKVVPNLSDVVKRIPHRIRCEAVAHADSTRLSTVRLGREYTIDVDYAVSAPLAFDEGAQIVYTDTIDGWNADIDKFGFAEGAYIELSADVDNKVPAYLTISAHAIDIHGKAIPESRIRVEVPQSVKASEDGSTVATTPIAIRLHEGERGALRQVDGLVYRIAAASGEQGATNIVGQTINAYNHTLTARNIKVKLVGKIIADFN